MKIRDGGYKLRLDAIPFQSAKSCSEILSDVSVQFVDLLLDCKCSASKSCGFILIMKPNMKHILEKNCNVWC